MSTCTIYLLDDDTEDGEDLELEVYVHYRIQPAEPDVGISGEYAEVEAVGAWVLPWGEISIRWAERYEDQIMEAAQEHLEQWEDCEY